MFFHVYIDCENVVLQLNRFILYYADRKHRIRHKECFVRDNIRFSHSDRSIYRTKHQLIIVYLTHQEHLFDFKASALTESSLQSLIA